MCACKSIKCVSKVAGTTDDGLVAVLRKRMQCITCGSVYMVRRKYKSRAN